MWGGGCAGGRAPVTQQRAWDGGWSKLREGQAGVGLPGEAVSRGAAGGVSWGVLYWQRMETPSALHSPGQGGQWALHPALLSGLLG